MLKGEGVEAEEVGIIFVDDDYIRELNRTYRKTDSVTDVLAFSMREGKGVEFSHGLLGDVYISWDRAVEQAEDYGVSLESEISRLVIHGVLHLLGYEHQNDESQEIMGEKEDHFLGLSRQLRRG